MRVENLEGYGDGFDAGKAQTDTLWVKRLREWRNWAYKGRLWDPTIPIGDSDTAIYAERLLSDIEERFPEIVEAPDAE